MDVATWATVASFAVSVLALFPIQRRDRTAEQEQLILALSGAYRETAQYLQLRETGERDEAQEWHLVMEWHRVGGLFEKYDPRISKMLFVKSRFWREGGTWDPERINEQGIGLDAIRAELERLLDESEGMPPEEQRLHLF